MDYLLQTPAQLASHLRALRKAKGLSQQQLGQLLGVGQTRIAKIEADPTSISVDQLFKLLATLGVRVLLSPQPYAEAPAGSTLSAQEPAPDDGSW
jgi:HTH-type transcriptional regulator/antitoxin HipB